MVLTEFQESYSKSFMKEKVFRHAISARVATHILGVLCLSNKLKNLLEMSSNSLQA